MARRYYRRRRYPRRRRTYRRRGTRSELMSYYATASAVFGTSISSTWQDYDVNYMWNNMQLGGRTSLRVAITSLRFDGVLQGGQAAGPLDDFYNTVRIVVAKWRSQYYDATTPWVVKNGWTVDSQIVRKWNDLGLQRVYMDRRFVLEPLMNETGGDGYVPNSYRVRFHLKFRKPLVLNWPQAGAPGPVVPQMPHLLISSVSDSGAIPNPGFVSGSMLLRWRNVP